MVTWTKADVAVGSVAASAPMWAPSLSQLNEVLTFLSLLGGLIFLGIRAYYYLKEKEK